MTERKDTTTLKPEEQKAFRKAIKDSGIITSSPIEIIADGKIHRFYVSGDKAGSRNGWYIYFNQGIATAMYGCWKRNIKKKWCVKSLGSLSPEELKAYRQNNKSASKAYKLKEEEVEVAAANRAYKKWGKLPEAKSDHPYLKKKGVKSYGLRLHQGKLVIPLIDVDENVCSLQFIDEDGNKRFLKRGRKKGCFFVIGVPSDELGICEGYATAASIHRATKIPMVVAFDAGNLLPVAEALREKYPEAKIIICADNDYGTEGNPGVEKATKAALVINAYISYPPERD